MRKTVIGTNLAHEKVEMDVSKLSLRVSVYGILIEDEKVLFTKQLGGFDLPGGGMEIDETLEECLEREYWEETGLKVKMEQVVDCKMNFFQYRDEDPLQCVLIYATCKKISGEFSIENMDQWEKDNGGELPEWKSLNELDAIQITNSIDFRPIIKKAAML